MDKLDELREIIKTKSKDKRPYISCHDKCVFASQTGYEESFCSLFDKFTGDYRRLPECIKEFGFKERVDE